MNDRDRIPGGALPPFIPGKSTLRYGARGGVGGAALPIAGGGPMPGPTLGASFSLQPPTWVRPPSARDFSISGTLAGAAVGTTPAAIPGAVFVVPAGNVGVIRSVVFLVNNLLMTSQVSFTLTLNAAAVEGWANIPVLPRVAASVSTSFGPEETAIPVPESNAIAVSVRVLDGAVYQVSTIIHGWFYPKEIQAPFDAAYTGL